MDHSRVRVRVALGSGVTALLLAAACGGDGETPSGTAGTAGSGGLGASGGTSGSGAASGGGGTSSGTPGGAFLTEYAAAVCAMYEPCCNAESLGFDLAGCTSWFSRVTDAYWDGDYQADEGEACLAALAAARDADPDRCSTISIFDVATLRKECERAFAAPPREGEPPGGPCTGPGHCATSEDTGAVCYGNTCVLQRPGAAGDGPCSLQGVEPRPTEAYTCSPDDGLFCDRRTNTCEPESQGGEYCPFPDACAGDAMCVGGSCQVIPAEGEPCLNGIQGAGGFCEPGSVCDASTLVCGPGLATGAVCRDAKSCESGVCKDGVCKASDFPDNLNCTG